MLFGFCRTERRPPCGGRTRLFTDEQEAAIVQMVVENNAIRLWEIIQQIIENPAIFNNIRVSLSTIARILHLCSFLVSVNTNNNSITTKT